jgi:hypothetical protein
MHRKTGDLIIKEGDTITQEMLDLLFSIQFQYYMIHSQFDLERYEIAAPLAIGSVESENRWRIDSCICTVGRQPRALSRVSIVVDDQTTGRGCEAMSGSYGMLDMTVYGRQEWWEDSPAGWPRGRSFRR